MRISARGSTRKTQALAKELVRFCAHSLMTSRLVNTLEVRIEFVDDLDHLDGECDYEDYGDPRPKDFIVRIKDSLPLHKQLRTICHEMVHVKQYARGELRYMCRPARHTKFQGTLYPEDIDYWARPWEIEAFDKEKDLFTDWLKVKKIKRIKDLETA